MPLQFTPGSSRNACAGGTCIKDPCSYISPCANIPPYLVDLETIPYGNRYAHPTSGAVVPEFVNLSYTDLHMKEGAFRQQPDFTRTRFREEDLEFNPTWRFNNSDYLPWRYQQPDYQMNFDERMIDTRQVHRDVATIKGRDAFLFKRYA